MTIERFVHSWVFILCICLTWLNGPAPSLGNTETTDTGASANKDVPDRLAQTLREAIQAAPLLSIDVSYTRRTVVPARVYEQDMERTSQLVEKLAKEHGWVNAKFRPPGFVNTANERVVFTAERVRIENPNRVRIDITYFAGDTQTTAKTREIVNMYSDGRFYRIDKTQRTIEIHDEPRFEGTNGMPMLFAGKLRGQPKVVADIVLASDPNSMVLAKSAVKKKCRYVGDAEIAGMAAVRIECGDADGGKRDCEFLLDPNDMGRCFKVVLYDRKTQNVVDTIEFSEFRKSKGGHGLYPYVTTRKKYDAEGNVTETETISVSDVATRVTIPSEELDPGGGEFAEYTVIDMRPSAPDPNSVDR